VSRNYNPAFINISITAWNLSFFKHLNNKPLKKEEFMPTEQREGYKNRK
jgi:hypothetical protein